ncbi:MAG: hypothetical protein ACLFSN_00130 [Candidatus Woesearchaeota archaeon]
MSLWYFINKKASSLDEFAVKVRETDERVLARYERMYNTAYDINKDVNSYFDKMSRLYIVQRELLLRDEAYKDLFKNTFYTTA